MTESNPNQPQPVDPFWEDFEVSGQKREAQLEADYKTIEGYNRILLNQVAGLEDDVLVPEEMLNEGPEDFDPSIGLKIVTANALLFLRPDRRAEISQSGEQKRVLTDGDPHTITGVVPERTQKLIDDLLTGIEAHPNQERSTTSEEAWVGNIAGQPIEIVKHRGILTKGTGDNETREPLLSIRAYRINKLPDPTVPPHRI